MPSIIMTSTSDQPVLYLIIVVTSFTMMAQLKATLNVHLSLVLL